MNLPTEIFDDVVVVHTPEELGTDQVDEFEAFISTLEHTQIVFDLDHTELLDSAGLTSILDTYDAMRERNGDVKLTTTNLSNRKILEITQIDRQVEVFDSVIDAVSSFR